LHRVAPQDASTNARGGLRRARADDWNIACCIFSTGAISEHAFGWRTRVRELRFGAADYISIRPLLRGLGRNGAGERVCFEPPAALVESFARGRYDAALIPSIEYLRGAGRFVLAGPALVGRSAPGGIVLVSQKPIEEIERVAVGEFCRTPVAVLRIVLGELLHVLPDLLVEKRIGEDDWRDRYDAALLTGDAALREALAEKTEGQARFNVTEMWKTLTRTPLVHAVWVYDDESRSEEIAHALGHSRDVGVEGLTTLAEETSQALGLDAMALYDYFTRAWSYDLGESEMEGLRALNDLSRGYDLLRDNRLAAALRA
jgi:chorismate dehydratase